MLGNPGLATTLPGVRVSHYIAVDLALLIVVLAVLAIGDLSTSQLLWLTIIWLAFSAVWVVLDLWWRRSND